MINNKYFKLPIEYLSNKQELTETLKDDLELIQVKESDCNPLYKNVFNPKSDCANEIMPFWSKYYTTDILFLKDSQKFITNYKPKHSLDCNSVYEEWNTFKEKKIDSFKEKYHYFGWSALDSFNKSSNAMQVLSLYNLGAPVLSLLMPVFLLIFPFFILKLKGAVITVKSYIALIKLMFARNSLFKLFTEFGSATLDKKLYLIMSVMFYVVQIYQNVMSCVNFYRNIHKITKFIKNTKQYILNTFDVCDELCMVLSPYKSYQPFITNIHENKIKLQKLYNNLCGIIETPYTLIKISQIGKIMKEFYELFTNAEYHESMAFSFGLYGYLENICQLQNLYKSKLINPCKFDKKTKFKKSYYVSLINNKPVKNSYSVCKNEIITGPNAAGKTTLLKSTLFNIICSQQFGLGFYSSASIHPYDYLHCYLNIPDTSGRDSLFQAEARRCKEIIQFIDDYPDKRHFCIFDELYSGTNPEDAVESADSFIKYLCKRPVTFMLTTHYIDLCHKLKPIKNIRNSCMKIIEENDNIKYTYKYKKGICSTKGGKQVLKDLGYPDEIFYT